MFLLFFEDELEHQLRDSGAKLVYTVKDLLSNCQDAVGQLPSVKVTYNKFNHHLNYTLATVFL